MTIYLLMAPACIEVLLINVPVWSVREEPGYCCDGLCSLAGCTRGEEDAALGLSGEGEEDVAAVAWRGGCEVY